MRDLNELEILDRIAVRSSLDAAARDLGVSPSTVSRKLAALERRLGVALVHRTTRALRLTAAGQAYAAHCREVCAAADRAEAAVAAHRESFAGNLTVNAATLFGRTVLAPVVFAFGLRHPAVRMQLSLTNAYVDPVSEGIDIAFRTGPLEDSTLRARKVGVARFALVASPACVARHGRPGSLAEVVQLPCLVFGRAEARWRCGTGDGIAVNTAFAADDLELLRDAAIAGLGFATLPRFLVQPPIDDGRLELIELDTGLSGTPVNAIFPAHGIQNPCARALAADVAAALERDPNWTA